MLYKDQNNAVHDIDPEFAHMLPPGCVQITEDEAEALRPRPPVPSLSEKRALVVKQIDADTDAIIGAVIGNRASEYELAEAQAGAYAAAGYTGAVPAYVQSWANAKASQGWSAQTAADDILATANNWRTAQATLRAQRLLRKEQAKAANDDAALEAVTLQWAGFLSVVKAQLGGL